MLISPSQTLFAHATSPQLEVWKQAYARLIAELHLLPIEVIHAESAATSRDARIAEMRTLANAYGALGSIALILARDHHGHIRIWLRNPDTDQLVMRETPVSAQDDPRRAELAVRAVELLRASLVEVHLEPLDENDARSQTQKPSTVPKGQQPQARNEQGASESPLTPKIEGSSQRLLSLDAGVDFLAPLSGSSVMIGPSFAAHWQMPTSLGVEGTLFWSAVPGNLHRLSQARIRVWKAAAGLTWRPLEWRRTKLDWGLFLGRFFLNASSTESRLAAFDRHAQTWWIHSGPRLRYHLSPHWALAAEGVFGPATSPINIEYEGERRDHLNALWWSARWVIAWQP